MNNLKTANAFVFNSELDANYLFSLYGDDYIYMQEIFDTVLQDFESLTAHIDYSYASGNLAELKSAIHKMKPVFGFVGLTTVQQQCQQFETICLSASSPDTIAGDFEALKNKISVSRQIIEEEKKKLELFNSNRS
jgi:HPt (histidine-containing phosphotransfer) domain-containing protein